MTSFFLILFNDNLLLCFNKDNFSTFAIDAKVNIMNLKNILSAIFAVAIFACQQSPFPKSEKSVEEIKAEGPISNADIIRNPVSAEGPVDTVNVAKMAFMETFFDFGEVQEGEIVKHTYQFTNAGRVPLIITDARSTCGCTVPTWPKEPIEPGDSGVISVEFNTKSKYREQKKPIIITANTYPARTTVYLEGFVNPEEATN